MPAVAWLLVMSSAWHGAELVFRRGLGVDSNADEHGEAAPAEEK